MLGLRGRACSGQQGVETEQMLALGLPLARMGAGSRWLLQYICLISGCLTG